MRRYASLWDRIGNIEKVDVAFDDEMSYTERRQPVREGKGDIIYFDLRWKIRKLTIVIELNETFSFN